MKTVITLIYLDVWLSIALNAPSILIVTILMNPSAIVMFVVDAQAIHNARMSSLIPQFVMRTLELAMNAF